MTTNQNLQTKIKLLFTLSLGILSSSSNLFAQNCLDIKKDDKITLEVTAYPLIHDKYGNEFYAMKPKKKAEKAAEYSKELSSGTVKPASTTSYVYKVTDINAAGEYEVTTNIAGTDYKSYSNCKDGNLYIIRVRGNMLPMVAGADTIGFYTKGVQIVPQNIKVGDLTPGYVDESIISYKNTEIQRMDFAIGETYGTYTGYVPAKAVSNTTGKVLTIYQPGAVLAEEQITVSGKTYKAYKVRTEIWTKNDAKTDTKIELQNWFGDPSFSKKIHSQLQSTTNAADEKVMSRLAEMSGVNEAGYLVTFKEEWIAPNIGVLKAINYDQWGCITSAVSLKSIE